MTYLGRPNKKVTEWCKKALSPKLTNAQSPGLKPMTVSMSDDVFIDGKNLKGYKRIFVIHEEYAGEIEIPSDCIYYIESDNRISLSRPFWNTVFEYVNPGYMPTRPITFVVETNVGSASISPTIP